jgi:hypothetical protein
MVLLYMVHRCASVMRVYCYCLAELSPSSVQAVVTKDRV